MISGDAPTNVTCGLYDKRALVTTFRLQPIIATLNKPENCGLVPEVAHVRMAGLNCYHEVAQVLELGHRLPAVEVLRDHDPVVGELVLGYVVP